MGKKAVDEVEDIQNEARESFDLGDFLRKRSMREKHVRLFTDEPLAEEIGGFEVIEKDSGFGVMVPKVKAWGITGRIAELTAEDKALPEGERKKHSAEIKRLTKQVEELADRLEATALEVHLRAVPSVAEDSARRKARKDAGIQGVKNPSPEQEEHFNRAFDEYLFSHLVVSIKNNETGAENEGATPETIRALRDYLPSSEWIKLIQAVAALQWENVIATEAVKNADF